MLHTTKGILLRTIKYSESSVIAHVFTDTFGMQSYMINGVRKSKAKVNPAILQAFNLLELVVYHSSTASIQKIASVRNIPIFASIPFHLQKNAIVQFITEITYKTLQQHPQDDDLFQFLYDEIQLLDQTEKDFLNFHVFFIVKLLHHLGILPNHTSGIFFDLQAGTFTDQAPNHSLFLLENNTLIFRQLLTDTSAHFSNQQRRMLTDTLVQYLQIHIDNIGNIHAHNILHEVFAD